MATLLIAHNPDGSVAGRCDARCYAAHDDHCDCICMGRNHGKGQQAAEANTVELHDEMIEAYTSKFPGVKAAAHPRLKHKQLNLFPNTKTTKMTRNVFVIVPIYSGLLENCPALFFDQSEADAFYVITANAMWGKSDRTFLSVQDVDDYKEEVGGSNPNELHYFFGIIEDPMAVSDVIHRINYGWSEPERVMSEKLDVLPIPNVPRFTFPNDDARSMNAVGFSVAPHGAAPVDPDVGVFQGSSVGLAVAPKLPSDAMVIPTPHTLGLCLNGSMLQPILDLTHHFHWMGNRHNNSECRVRAYKAREKTVIILTDSNVGTSVTNAVEQIASEVHTKGFSMLKPQDIVWIEHYPERETPRKKKFRESAGYPVSKEDAATIDHVTFAHSDNGNYRGPEWKHMEFSELLALFQ